MPVRADVVNQSRRCFDLGACLRKAVEAQSEILSLDSVLHLTSDSTHGCEANDTDVIRLSLMLLY